MEIPTGIKIHVSEEYLMIQRNAYIITEKSWHKPIYSMTGSLILFSPSVSVLVSLCLSL